MYLHVSLARVGALIMVVVKSVGGTIRFALLDVLCISA